MSRRWRGKLRDLDEVWIRVDTSWTYEPDLIPDEKPTKTPPTVLGG